MSIPGSLLQHTPEDESGKTWDYPRAAFTYMARDQRTAHGVAEMAAALTQQVCFKLASHVLHRWEASQPS